MQWESEQKTQPVQDSLVIAFDYSLSSSATCCKAICQWKKLRSVSPNLLKIPCLSFCSSGFLGLLVHMKLIMFFQICRNKVKCLPGKIRKLLVFSFWNEQKYYQTHQNKTTLKNHLLPPLFPQSLRYFSLNIFREIEELQLLVTSANNSGHEFLRYSPGPCRDRWCSSFTVLHILTLQYTEPDFS